MLCSARGLYSCAKIGGWVPIGHITQYKGAFKSSFKIKNHFMKSAASVSAGLGAATQPAPSCQQ